MYVAPGRRPGRSWPSAPLRLLPAVLALVLLPGCRVDVGVEVEAGPGGGGRVRVAVGLDEEAAAQVPDLAGQLRVEDLEATGWEVEGPTPTPGGGASLRASKPFSSPAEAVRVVEELSGPSGPFSSLRLTHDRGFWKTTTGLSGAVDLTAGLDVFGDDILRQRLGGPTLGVDPAAVERELGRPLAEVFTFELVADLPGRVDSNAPDRRAGDAVWPAALGAVVAVRASAEAWNVPNLAAAAVAVVSGLGLVVVLGRGRRAAGPR